jgi:hypothetical protein
MRTAILVAVLGIFVLIFQQNGGFLRKYTAEEVSDGFDLSGQVGIVTGANTGIGQETARVFALRGMHVIMVSFPPSFLSFPSITVSFLPSLFPSSLPSFHHGFLGLCLLSFVEWSFFLLSCHPSFFPSFLKGLSI